MRRLKKKEAKKKRQKEARKTKSSEKMRFFPHLRVVKTKKTKNIS